MTIATTGAPPYYAVIFTSVLAADTAGYAETSAAMVEAAERQPGFRGFESAREGEGGLGITVSYWDSLEAIAAWKSDATHLIAQRTGRERWYESYRTRICRVEREYGFTAA
jgi:heme-degrading monooxygenase HmoA